MRVLFCFQVRAAVFSADKQSHLAWLLRVILQTVKLASKEGQLFAYVPDFYLDSLVEICAALRTYMHPTAPLENIEGTELLLYMFSCVK
jgi:Kip1 ubiquitination-promoting complex protein 1